MMSKLLCSPCRPLARNAALRSLLLAPSKPSSSALSPLALVERACMVAMMQQQQGRLSIACFSTVAAPSSSSVAGGSISRPGSDVAQSTNAIYSNDNSNSSSNSDSSNSNDNSNSIDNSSRSVDYSSRVVGGGDSFSDKLSAQDLEDIMKRNDQYDPNRHKILADIVKETKLSYITENHEEYFKTTAMYFRMEEEKALRKIYPGLVRLPKKHPGRLNAEQADSLFEKYRLDPAGNPPEALAVEFKLDVEIVKKLLKIYQYPIHKKDEYRPI